MGGNVSINKFGKTYKADKIPVKEIGLKQFQEDIRKLLHQLNKDFEKDTGKKIWKKDSLIDDAIIFNGSTSYLMDAKMLSKEEELLKLKPSSGDIDIVLPEDLKEELWYFLQGIEGKKYGKFVYLGCNKPSVKSIIDQINGLFEYNSKAGKVYAQIDFEFAKYENDSPDEFARFGHSSTFKDLQNGVKAVFHKYLLRSISHSMSEIDLDKYVVVTNSANCANYEKKLKRKPKDLHFLKFSVSKGIRVAFEELKCNDEIVKIDDKIVLRELKTSESIYKTDVKEILKVIFKIEPTQSEITDFWSFVGVIDLLKKYASKDQIIKTFERFTQLLYENKDGKNIGQELERGNAKLDYEIKNGAISYFIKEFPYLEKYLDEKMVKTYYDNYGARELGELFKESLIEVKGLEC